MKTIITCICVLALCSACTEKKEPAKEEQKVIIIDNNSQQEEAVQIPMHGTNED